MIRYVLIGISLLMAFVIATFLSLPNVKTLEGCIVTNMNKVKLCPDKGHYVRLNNISKTLIDTVLAAEDSAFYSHQGFDWFEMRQSFEANMKTGKLQRGGSTITQQLAKNVFLYKEKSYWRKIKEAYLTFALERSFSKNFILEKYLNVVEFGPNLYGVKDAAQYYFQKSPSQLNPLESAYLAFLLPNPKAYSKTFRTGELTPYTQKMLKVLLLRMKSFKKISDDTYNYAVSQIDDFPWSNLYDVDFANPPTVAAAETTDEVISEEDLEVLLQEELGNTESEEQYEN